MTDEETHHMSAPEYHQFGTWCLRGGGHIDVDHECRRRGLDLLVRFNPNDFVSREELEGVLDQLYAKYADEPDRKRVPYEAGGL